MKTAVRGQIDSNMRGQIDSNMRGQVDSTVYMPGTNMRSRIAEVALAGPPGPKVAIVDVDGPMLNANLTGLGALGENPLAAFSEKLEAAAATPDLAAVVLRVNSAGGSAAAADMMRAELVAFRHRRPVPVVACVMDLGCGGAYGLATAADRIVALPTSVVGGLAVALNLYNLRETMAYFNVVPQSVKSGEHADLGAPTQALKPEARKLLEAIAAEFHERLKKTVVEARPKLAGKSEPFDGRVYSASQALELGLIDGLGTLDDALAEARRRANAGPGPTVLFRRAEDPAFSKYAVTPNLPSAGLAPLGVPGLDRSKLPTFLYMWDVEPTSAGLAGR